MAALLVSITALLPLLSGASPAGAVTNGTFGIEPYTGQQGGARSAFFFQAQPGQTLADRFSLFNFTGQPITFRLFATDAYNTKSGGQFSLTMPNATTSVLPAMTGVGKWTAIPITRLVVKPRTRADVPFTMSIPVNAAPGDHIGGIVGIDLSATTTKPGRIKVLLRSAEGVRVYLRVAGPLVPRMDVNNMDLSAGLTGPLAPFIGPPGGSASFNISNVGNTLVQPTLQLRVSDLLGRTVATRTIKDVAQIIPGQSVHLKIPLGSLSGIGPRYQLKVNAKSGTASATGSTSSSESTSASASSSLWTVPWLLIILLVLAIILEIVLVRRRRRRGAEEGAQ